MNDNIIYSSKEFSFNKDSQSGDFISQEAGKAQIKVSNPHAVVVNSKQTHLVQELLQNVVYDLGKKRGDSLEVRFSVTKEDGSTGEKICLISSTSEVNSGDKEALTKRLAVFGFNDLKIVILRPIPKLTADQIQFLEKNNFLSEGRLSTNFFNAQTLASTLETYEDVKTAYEIFKAAKRMPSLEGRNLEGAQNFTKMLLKAAAEKQDTDTITLVIDDLVEALQSESLDAKINGHVLNISVRTSIKDLSSLLSFLPEEIPLKLSLTKIKSDNFDHLLSNIQGAIVELSIIKCDYQSIELSGFDNMKDVSIEQCPLLSGPIIIKNSPKLSSVNVRGCAGMIAPPILEATPNLITINLSYCKSLREPPDLSQCPYVSEVVLTGTAIEHLPNILNIENIKTLDLTECPNLNSSEATEIYNRILPADPDLREKCEGYHICSAKTWDEEAQGYLYDFKHSSIILNGDTELFPAVQSQSLTTPHVSQNPKNDLYALLGYQHRLKSEGVYKTITAEIFPDANVLNFRWNQLKESRSLPDLTFINSEGIADDRSFIRAFLDGKLVISSGNEFIHDHTAHVIRSIQVIIQCQQKDFNKNLPPGTVYNELMTSFRTKIEQLSNFLNDLDDYLESDQELKKEYFSLSEELKTIIGMTVDGGTNFFSWNQVDSFVSNNFADMAVLATSPSDLWYQYFTNRYGNEVHARNAGNLEVCWKYLTDALNDPTKFSPEGLLGICHTRAINQDLGP